MFQAKNENKETKLLNSISIIANQLNQSKADWHFSQHELEIFLDNITDCIYRILKKKEDDNEIEITIKNILINYHRISPEFVKGIIAKVVHPNKELYETNILIERIITHLKSCKALYRSPGDFEQKIKCIIENYLSDGELVEVLLGRNHILKDKELIEKIKIYYQNIARRKLKVHEERIEDFVQEAWIEIFANLKDFHFLSRFLSWATTILIRVHYTIIRHEMAQKSFGSKNQISLETPLELDKGYLTIGDTITSTETDPEKELIIKEIYLLISQEINSLKGKINKKIGNLAILDQLKPNEIAKELNMDPRRVSSILFRIKKVLRENSNDFRIL